jgi:uncharacterized membrane protein
MGVGFARMGVDLARAEPRKRALSVLTAASLSAVIGTGVTASAVTASPRASAAKHDADAVTSKLLFISEKSQLRLASAPGVTIKEQGSLTGTFKGTVVAYFTSYSISRGSLTLTGYIPGGVVTVQGETHNRVAGSTGYSEGIVHIIHGTGKFAHASSKTLQFHAIVNRKNFYITAEVQGRMSL